LPFLRFPNGVALTTLFPFFIFSFVKNCFLVLNLKNQIDNRKQRNNHGQDDIQKVDANGLKNIGRERHQR